MDIKESILDKYIKEPLTDDGHIGLTSNVYGYIDYSIGAYVEKLRNTTENIRLIEISQFKKPLFSSWNPITYKIKHVVINGLDLVLVLVCKRRILGHHHYFTMSSKWNVGQSTQIIDLLIIDRSNYNYKYYYGDNNTLESDKTSLADDASSYSLTSETDFYIKQSRQEFNLGYTDFIVNNNEIIISYMDKALDTLTVDKMSDSSMPQKEARGRTYKENGITLKNGSKSLNLLLGKPKLLKYKLMEGSSEWITDAYTLTSSGIYNTDSHDRYGMKTKGGYTSIRLASSSLKPNYIFFIIRYECYLQLPYTDNSFALEYNWVTYGYGGDTFSYEDKIITAPYNRGNIVGICGYEIGFIDTEVMPNSTDAVVTILHNAPGEGLPIASAYKSDLDNTNYANAWRYIGRYHTKRSDGEDGSAGGDPDDKQLSISTRDVIRAHNYDPRYRTTWFTDNGGKIAMCNRKPTDLSVANIMSNLPLYKESELLPVVDRCNHSKNNEPYVIPIGKAMGNVTEGGSITGTDSYTPNRPRYFAQSRTHHSNSFMVTFSSTDLWPIFIISGVMYLSLDLNDPAPSYLPYQSFFIFRPFKKELLTTEPSIADMQNVQFVALGLERDKITKRSIPQTVTEGNILDGTYDPYDMNACSLANFDCEWSASNPRLLNMVATIIQTPSPLLQRPDRDLYMWQQALINDCINNEDIQVSDVFSGVREKTMFASDLYSDLPTKIDVIQV